MHSIEIGTPETGKLNVVRTKIAIVFRPLLFSFLRSSLVLTTLVLTSTLALSTSLNAKDTNTTTKETPAGWYASGKSALERTLQATQAAAINATTPAKNIILFIGDGMGISTVTAARIYAGQKLGKLGEEHQLFFENFPNVALVKTYNVNQQTPDSAGTMTAIMSGIKTDAGLIGVNQHVELGNCSTQLGNEVSSALELAEIASMATGVVSTARLTHATPAATYAHSMHRNFESDADAKNMTVAGKCKDIAAQLIDLPKRFNNSAPWVDGLEVALGGGKRNFIGVENNGKRLDGRHLPQEWLSRYKHAAYVQNANSLNAVDTNTTKHLLGLFSDSHMAYTLDDHHNNSKKGRQPTLSEMTTTAIELLSKNKVGFFLQVEAGRIDHAHHSTHPKRALEETLALAQAVETAYAITDPKETLIIVTADHSHVFTLAGYPTRGNPILGKVIGNQTNGEARTTMTLAQDGKPYTSVGYVNGPKSITANLIKSRENLKHMDTQHTEFQPESLIPIAFETHSTEDVAIYATGPGSALVNGVMEQHVIFHVMNFAGRLEERAQQAIAGGASASRSMVR